MEVPEPVQVLAVAVDRTVRRLIATFLVISVAPFLLTTENAERSALTGAAAFLLAVVLIAASAIWWWQTGKDHTSVNTLAVGLGVTEMLTVLVLGSGALAAIVTGSALPYVMVTIATWTVLISLAFGMRRYVLSSLPKAGL